MPLPQITRVLAMGTVAAVASFAGAGFAAAADLAPPTVTTDGGKHTMVLDAHTVKETFTPKGGTPSTAEPTSEPKAGDTFSFVDENKQGGKLVSTDEGTCSITGPMTSTCKVTVTFVDGTIVAGGAVTFSEGSESDFKLLGGTGAYAGISGNAHVVDVNETDSTVTLTYTLGGGQVSETPSGGAETGDGSTAGTQSPWLLGLGAAAAAFGAVLLGGAARRVRRS